MQYLFIVVAVAAIVVYSAQHDLTSLTQFMDSVRGDMLSLMLWLAIAIAVVAFVFAVMRMARKK